MSRVKAISRAVLEKYVGELISVGGFKPHVALFLAGFAAIEWDMNRQDRLLSVG